MGAGQSAPAPASPSQGANAEPASPDSDGVTKLFRLVQGKGFEVEALGVQPHFFDVNEDSPSVPRQWCLEVGDIETDVSDNFAFDQTARRVTFVSPDGIWALRFGSKQEYAAFTETYNDKLFENTFKVDNDEGNRNKVFGKDSFLTLGKETEESRRQWADAADDEEAPDLAELKTPAKRGREKDAILGVRLGAGGRSYMVQDKKIGVLRNVHGGVQDTGLSFNSPSSKRRGSSLGTPGDASGSGPTPSKLLLMHGERQMNMLSPEAGSSLYQMDIETGKTVAEWGFQKDGTDVSMKDLVNDTKGAQLDERDTFLGVGTNRLVRWDQRAPEGIVQDMSSPIVSYAGGKDYARNTNFNCMATSGDGHVVVGSDDGKIRLFSSATLTMAKTSIPGLGAPITAVDVSHDSMWVLATTSKYLMVVKTQFRDKSGRETNGFKSRMGAQAPAPRLLRLKAEDQAKVGRAPLQKGKFTWITEAGRQERWIVASCGAFTVLWNFRQVKLAESAVQSYGGLTTVTEYHLIPRQEDVVDSTFMHDNYASPGQGGAEDAMVVFTKHRVWSLADDDSED
jgi:hypothetical protein